MFAVGIHVFSLIGEGFEDGAFTGGPVTVTLFDQVLQS
jgi:hypothetical protein